MEQIEPIPWVSSVTFPRKPNGEVRVCLDPSNLNGAIIRENNKPMMREEIAHKMAGTTVYSKADALKAFFPIHLTKEASLDNIQLTQRKTLLSLYALWSKNEPRHVQDLDGYHSDDQPLECVP